MDDADRLRKLEAKVSDLEASLNTFRQLDEERRKQSAAQYADLKHDVADIKAVLTRIMWIVITSVGAAGMAAIIGVPNV